MPKRAPAAAVRKQATQRFQVPVVLRNLVGDKLLAEAILASKEASPRVGYIVLGKQEPTEVVSQIVLGGEGEVTVCFKEIGCFVNPDGTFARLVLSNVTITYFRDVIVLALREDTQWVRTEVQFSLTGLLLTHLEGNKAWVKIFLEPQILLELEFDLTHLA